MINCAKGFHQAASGSASMRATMSACRLLPSWLDINSVLAISLCICSIFPCSQPVSTHPPQKAHTLFMPLHKPSHPAQAVMYGDPKHTTSFLQGTLLLELLNEGAVIGHRSPNGMEFQRNTSVYLPGPNMLASALYYLCAACWSGCTCLLASPSTCSSSGCSGLMGLFQRMSKYLRSLASLDHTRPTHQYFYGLSPGK